MSRSTFFVAGPIVVILGLATIFSQRWDADKPKIGLAVANLQADFFNQIKQSVTKEAAKQGVEVVVADARGDAATQVNQIEDFVTKKVDAIVYIPAGATAAGVPVKDAKRAGIPIIAVDRNPPDEPANSFIASDSVAAAKTLGEHVAKETGGEGSGRDPAGPDRHHARDRPQQGLRGGAVQEPRPAGRGQAARRLGPGQGLQPRAEHAPGAP